VGFSVYSSFAWGGKSFCCFDMRIGESGSERSG
jgi:hypothetical protein